MNLKQRNPIIPLGTKTKWGIVEAIGILSGERYYWMLDEHKTVSMMPDFMVEEDVKSAIKPNKRKAKAT